MKHCIQCGRAIRPRKARKEDYPGTVLTGAHGKCDACYTRDRKRAKLAVVTPTGEPREVLTRVYLTASTYKTLRQARVDVSSVLSKVADQIAAEVSRRA